MLVSQLTTTIVPNRPDHHSPSWKSLELKFLIVANFFIFQQSYDARLRICVQVRRFQPFAPPKIKGIVHPFTPLAQMGQLTGSRMKRTIPV